MVKKFKQSPCSTSYNPLLSSLRYIPFLPYLTRFGWRGSPLSLSPHSFAHPTCENPTLKRNAKPVSLCLGRYIWWSSHFEHNFHLLKVGGGPLLPLGDRNPDFLRKLSEKLLYLPCRE